MLKESTDSEMTKLRETLVTLSDRLEGAGQAIGTGAGEAAEKLDKAGSDLLSRVEQVTQALGGGASNLDAAAQGVKEAMNDLDVSVRDAAELGRQGAAFVREALTTAEDVFGRLRSAAEELRATGTMLDRLSGALTDAVDSVEEMAQEQGKVVEAVRTATPEAMASVQRVVDLLQQSVRSISTTMNQTRDAMGSTSKTLQETVTQITAGVSEYSSQVAELHRRMDNELARAVGGLHKGVEELEGAIEELGETLATRERA